MSRFIFFSTLFHILLAGVFIFFSDKSILSRLSSLSFLENSSEIQEEQEDQADLLSSQTLMDSQKPVDPVKKVSKKTKKPKKKVLAKKNVKPALQAQNISKKNSQKKSKTSAPVLTSQKKEPPSTKHLKPEEPVFSQTIKKDEKQKNISPNDLKNEQSAVADLTETKKAFDELEQEEDFSEFNTVLNKMEGDPPLSSEDLAQLAKPSGKTDETPPDHEDIPLIPKEAEKKLIQADQNASPPSPVPDSKEIKSYKTLRQSPGNPKPVYPDQARQNNQQGSVLLLYFVDDSGLVDKMQLLKSSGHSLLDNEALRVLSRQQYLPGQSGWYKHRVDFRLKQIEDTSLSLSSG